MSAEFATLDDINTDAGVASIKVFHDVKSNETGYDAVIKAHIPAIIAYVKMYCGHDFLQTTRTNESPYILPNERHFYLDNYPVASVQSCVEQGLTLVEGTDFYCDRDAGRIEKIDIPMNVLNPDRFTSAYWSIVRQSIFITYVGGVALDDSMIAVVKEMVGLRAGIKKRTWTDQDGIEKVTTLNSLSPVYQQILDSYRRRKVRHLQNF